MSDNIPLEEQRACLTLAEGHDEMKYYLFTSVDCAENNTDEKQLLLYIYGDGNESSVKVRQLLS